MNLLLDTHSLIWFLNGDTRLSKKARNAIENLNNNTFVSIATLWEIGIKISLGKLHIKKGFPHFIELVGLNGFELFPITPQHTIIISSMEYHHRDPFDRILIAQCMEAKLTLVTRDETMKRYGINIID